MTQQENDVAPAIKRVAPARWRVANFAAQLVGSAGLAFGAVSTLAKRRRDRSDGDSEHDRGARRDERRNARQEDDANDDKTQSREARQERRDARQEDAGRDDNARNDSVDRHQRAGKQSNNNNSSNNNDSNNSNDENTTDDEDGGNNRGNAGSGFFDSPLARKTQRRANDFDNNQGRDDEPRDDNLTADNGDEQHIETNSISFTNGPDGLEVVTGNIEYSAPPTPTPTPFPTLTLPERDRLDVFGDRVIAAPTPVPANNGTSSGSAPPPSTDSGTTGSTGSRPTPTPSSDDTSGGDNTSDFLS